MVSRRSLVVSISMALCCLAVGGGATGVSGVGGLIESPSQPSDITPVGRHVAVSLDVTANTVEQRDDRQYRTTNGTVIMISLHADGDALVRISYHLRLDTDRQATGFERLQRDIESNRTGYTEAFTRRMTTVVRSAERSTGRSMAVENVSVRTQRLSPRLGVVTYSFVWQDIAAVSDDQLRLGHALSGFSLDQRTRLVIAWPEEYETRTVRPTPDERRAHAVVWTGPATFGKHAPRIVLSSAPDASASPPLLVGVLVGGGLILALAGMVWWVRHERSDDHTDGSPAVGADRVRSADESTAPSAEQSDMREATSESPSEDDELLSNEEQVLQVLDHHDGRMKQQQIIAALGWSETKTSQVISGLRAEGRVEGFRLGRENVLQLHSDPQESDEEEPNSNDTG